MGIGDSTIYHSPAATRDDPAATVDMAAIVLAEGKDEHGKKTATLQVFPAGGQPFQVVCHKGENGGEASPAKAEKSEKSEKAPAK